MRILFDQATPVPIRPYLAGHTVSTAFREGWDTLRNGELLAAAEEARFDVFVTTDKNMRYQQNPTGRRIAVIVLGQQQWPHVRPHIQRVVDAVNAAAPGSFAEVEIPYPRQEALTPDGGRSPFSLHGVRVGQCLAGSLARNSVEVGDVLGAAGSLFVLPEETQAEERHRQAVKFRFHALGPGFVEGDSGDAGDDVDAVRIDAQLDDLIGLFEIFACDVERAETKFAERAEQAFGVAAEGLTKKSMSPVERGTPWKERAHAPTTMYSAFYATQ